MGRPISGYPPEAAVSPVPDPRYAATSPAHRTARPSIFHIKRDTTGRCSHPAAAPGHTSVAHTSATMPLQSSTHSSQM
jgi:hypothetical protein